MQAREITQGLPELARFWLTTRLLKDPSQPVMADTAAAAGIPGPIFEHCRPHDLSGLTTRSVQHLQSGSKEAWTGWDGESLAGHFNIFDLDWWFRDDIQVGFGAAGMVHWVGGEGEG